MNHNPLVNATLRNLHLEKEMIEETFKKHPAIKETMGCDAEEFYNEVHSHECELVESLFSRFGMVSIMNEFASITNTFMIAQDEMSVNETGKLLSKVMKSLFSMINYTIGTLGSFGALGYCTMIYLKTVFDTEEEMIKQILASTMLPVYGEDFKEALDAIYKEMTK